MPRTILLAPATSGPVPGRAWWALPRPPRRPAPQAATDANAAARPAVAGVQFSKSTLARGLADLGRLPGAVALWRGAQLALVGALLIVAPLIALRRLQHLAWEEALLGAPMGPAPHGPARGVPAPAMPACPPLSSPRVGAISPFGLGYDSSGAPLPLEGGSDRPTPLTHVGVGAVEAPLTAARAPFLPRLAAEASGGAAFQTQAMGLAAATARCSPLHAAHNTVAYHPVRPAEAAVAIAGPGSHGALRGALQTPPSLAPFGLGGSHPQGRPWAAVDPFSGGRALLWLVSTAGARRPRSRSPLGGGGGRAGAAPTPHRTPTMALSLLLMEVAYRPAPGPFTEAFHAKSGRKCLSQALEARLARALPRSPEEAALRQVRARLRWPTPGHPGFPGWRPEW